MEEFINNINLNHQLVYILFFRDKIYSKILNVSCDVNEGGTLLEIIVGFLKFHIHIFILKEDTVDIRDEEKPYTIPKKKKNLWSLIIS